LNRRQFLKYAAAAAAVAGVSTLGLNYDIDRPTTITKTNTAPVANFSFTPRFLMPSADQPIQFTNLSTTPDDDPLTYTWLVDGHSVSHDKNYATTLPAGQHQIQLQLSDGQTAGLHVVAITVEPGQLSDPSYQPKPLFTRYKGTGYVAGLISPEFKLTPNPSEEQMNEELDTIKNELGCNAIIIYGGELSEDKILQCSELAIEKNFDRIIPCPRYVDSTPDDTIEKIGKFSSKVKSLREKSDDVILSVGHEIMIASKIIRGDTIEQRTINYSQGIDLDKVTETIPRMFKSIIDVCNKNYGYPITYASHAFEADKNLIPWDNPAFRIIGVNTYLTSDNAPAPRREEAWWLKTLTRLKIFGKPIYATDWGMFTYRNADQWGDTEFLHFGQQTYDEDPQVRYATRTLNMLNEAGVDGSFWAQYNDDFDRGQGLYNPKTLQRKKGFYMYKSYQLHPPFELAQ
jgi:hypothetical protein